MKTTVIGFDKPQTEWIESVLESPAFGPSNQEKGRAYRWILLPNGYSPKYPDTKPIIQAEQQFANGSWGPCGPGWNVESLLFGDKWSGPHTSDTICLGFGQNWYVSGLQAALNEAKSILNL